MVKVSVIIPTFRRPEFITEAIESVLHQTMEDVDIVVVDDNGVGTADQVRNADVLREYINSKKINYIVHECNKNGAAARNTGIANSDSEYIAFLDDDDIFLPDKLQYQIKALEESNADICLCGFIRSYIGHSVTYTPNQDEVTIPNVLMHRVDTCAGSCLLVKRKLVNEINGFDETFERQQDLEFLIRLLKKGKLVIAEETLVKIRMHEQNLRTPNLSKTIEQRTHFLNSFKNDILELPKDLAKEIYDVQYIEIAKIALKNHRFAETLKWIGKTSHPIETSVLLARSALKFLSGRKKQ